MPLLNRSLTVTLDGELFPFSGRIRLRGEDELSLFPALFTLELWNLPEEYFLRLFRAGQISVSHEDACLVYGRVWDVFRRGTEEGVLTSVSVSIGLELWESVVSLAVPAGTTLSGAVRAILSASGTGIPLLSGPDPDPVLSRGLSFFGRAAECITEILGGRNRPSRPMLTPSGVMVVSSGGLSEAVRITETDLTDAVAFAGGTLRGTPPLAVLSAAVSGWRPGQTVEVRQGNISFRGIIRSRSVDADTGTGPWKSEMIAEVL